MTTERPGSAGSPACRVLLYTHNALGLGHVFRSLAVITGLKRWAPHWDFLVVSGSSIPQVFLAEGVEVLKLPGVRLQWADGEASLRPRHLDSMALDEVFDLRCRLIADACDCFAPDVVLVEHNPAGLMNELVPLLMKKRLRRGGARDFALAHISRGILSAYPRLQLPRQSPPHLSGSVDLAELYDFIYVLEDRSILGEADATWDAGPALAGRTAFLGKIGIKNRAELPPLDQAKRAWGLDESPLILLSLGRLGPVARLTKALGQALACAGLLAGRQLAAVLDPYLPPAERAGLERWADGIGARLLGFNPYLVELINAAELVVCRAGYNTCNEVRLCGARALLVPEPHGGLEQERRAAALTGPHQASASEAQVLAGEVEEDLKRLLAAPRDPDPPVLDRFAAGRRIARDLTQWLDRRPGAAGGERETCRA
ncbi:MAG: glycosyltransferase family protein [Thermodesulfobacteriota bacterium]